MISKAEKHSINKSFLDQIDDLSNQIYENNARMAELDRQNATLEIQRDAVVASRELMLAHIDAPDDVDQVRPLVQPLTLDPTVRYESKLEIELDVSDNSGEST